MEVTFSKGIFSRSWHSGPSRRRKGIVETILERQEMTISQHLAKFKYMQTQVPITTYRRLISTGCLYCLPMSERQIDQELKAMGIINLFNLPTQNSDAPWMSRQFSFVSHFWEQGGLSADQIKFVHRQDIVEDDTLFQYPTKVMKHLYAENIKMRTALVDSAAKTMAVENLYSAWGRSTWMLGPFSGKFIVAADQFRRWIFKFFIRMVGYVSAKVLKRLFEAVCVHEGELDLLVRAHASALPIIYVPINRSFMDSIILKCCLIHAGLPIPYFFMSSKDSQFLSLVGGIRRPNIPRPDRSAADYPNDADMARTAVITSFVKELLQNGSSLQLQMESNKSRTGKSSTELYGTELLKVVYDIYEERDIEDAYIVPVSVSYDILPEDSTEWFSGRQQNKLYGIWSYLWKFVTLSKLGLGSSRINFGQPFSLREYLASMRENKKFHSVAAGDNTIEVYYKTFESSELNWMSRAGSTASIPSVYGELDLIDFVPEELDTTLPRINLLAFHAVYSATTATAIMGTHAVAFLLLKKFRSGTNLVTLVQEVEDLVKYLELRKRGCGFTGNVKGVVLHALEALGPESVAVQVLGSKDDFIWINPILSEGNLLRLGYYANYVLPVFAMEAIVAVAVCALEGNQLKVSRGFDVDIRVKDEDLIHYSRILYQALATEFFLHSPCILGLTAIRRAIEALNSECVLQYLMDETVRRNRRYYEVEEDFYEDDFAETATASNNPGADDVAADYFFTPYEYKIVSSEENVDRLFFLKSLIIPTLEIYAFIGKELAKIQTGSDGMKRVDKRIFQKSTLSKLTESFDGACYGEYLSMDHVKASLFAFESNGIFYISNNSETGGKYIDMSYDTDSSRKLQQSLDNLLRLIT